MEIPPNFRHYQTVPDKGLTRTLEGEDVTPTGTSIEQTTLQSWGETFGLTGASLLPGADDDGDGISLLEEYAYNLDPTVNENST